MKIEDKIVWILSPDKWGPIRISKHHYATELSRRGNIVYFFNPPRKGLIPKIKVDNVMPNLNVVNFSFYIPGYRFLHEFFEYCILKVLILGFRLKLKCKPNILWSFNYTLFKDLRIFKSDSSILHIMDFTNTFVANGNFYYADHIFTVTKSISDIYNSSRINIIPHGLNSIYEQNALNLQNTYKFQPNNKKFRICLIGALLYNLDHQGILTLIKEFPECSFDFIGPYSKKDIVLDTYINSEIYNENNCVLELLDRLENSDNVNLLGVIGNEEIVKFYNQYDVFLLLYRKTNDNRIFTNSHKIYEYFSTGKTVFTNIGLDEELNDLVFLSDNDIKQSFKKLLDNLTFYNSKELAIKRLELAVKNSYRNNIKRIEEFLVTR